jgi:copper(I)-binding protein
MKEGEARKATFEFKNAGKVEIEFTVQSIAATMKHGKMGKDGMDHKKMKHGEIDKSKMKKESN